MVLRKKKFSKPLTPQNTIIAFDIHDVLFDYDYKSILKHLLTLKNKLKLIIIFLNPFIWIDVVKLKMKNSITEQYILELPKKYPNLKPYIATGIQIANSQIANKEMIKIVKALKSKGYELHIFSNIGEILFKELQKKFPDIFNYFDKFIVPSQHNGYLRKPYQEAFTHLISKNKASKRNIIFIDDKKKNIKTAIANNIIGIHFKCPHQLRDQLKILGIFIENF